MMEVISTSAKTVESIPSIAVDWVRWRDVLSQYFKAPSAFKITHYQVFEARIDTPGVIFAKRLHDSIEESSFMFYGGSTSELSSLSRQIEVDTTKDSFRSTPVPLSEVKSSNHSNRQRYLEKCILDPLFPNDENFKRLFVLVVPETKQRR